MLGRKVDVSCRPIGLRQGVVDNAGFGLELERPLEVIDSPLGATTQRLDPPEP